MLWFKKNLYRKTRSPSSNTWIILLLDYIVCPWYPLVIVQTPFSLILNLIVVEENQDGGVGRHTTPPRTTRADRKSNGREVRHQVQIKKKPTSRPVGGAETGTGAERTRMAMAGPRLAVVWDERGRRSDH